MAKKKELVVMLQHMCHHRYGQFVLADENVMSRN